MADLIPVPHSNSSMLLQHGNCRRAQGQLGENLCVIDKVSQTRRPWYLFRDYQSIASIQAHACEAVAENAILRLPAHHRAVGPDDERISAIGALCRSPGQPQVTSHGLRPPEEERVLVVHGSHHVYRTGLGRNYEAIAVLQLYVRQAGNSCCVLRDIQYHAAGGAYGAEPGHQTSGGGG